MMRPILKKMDHPALSTGLITYIGNKRSLIPFISGALDRIESERGPTETMADPFAGSGVVARLGRLRGYRVAAGDLEVYTRPFGRAFLEVDRDEVDAVFSESGGYQETISYLNSLTRPERSDDCLFSAHYAPSETQSADPERERMFFTRENALRIDAMLAAIHRDLPLTPQGRDILLASLLVEMSIHNNTSGVMKGFHHGWGGRGGDALARIMAPVMLEELPFIDGPRGYTHVGPADSLATAARDSMGIDSFDVVYADPPYNIHQYGANYHLLTTAVRWDFYDPGPVERGARAGIRRDHNKSDFCSRRGDRARVAFESFLDSITTRTVLVSYNNDGIIDAPTMAEILMEDGINTVIPLVREHHKFRGGKATQSALRTDEYLFIVYRGKRQSSTERDGLRRYMEDLALRRELNDRFILPSRWQGQDRSARYNKDSSTWILKTGSGGHIQLSDDFRVRHVSRDNADTGQSDEWHRIVKVARLSSGTMVETVDELIRHEMYDAAIRQLRRLKIKKYRSDFLRIVRELRHRELTSAGRRRLSALYTRVTGEVLEDDGIY